jgi:hypothetical protein
MIKLDYDKIIGSKPNNNIFLWLAHILFLISYGLRALFGTSIILLAKPKMND